MSSSDKQLFKDADRLTRIYSIRYSIYKEHDDVFQEVCIALLQARNRFDPTKGTWNYYSTIYAHGAVLDYLRRTVPKQQHEYPYDQHEEYLERFVQLDDQSFIFNNDFLSTLKPKPKFIALCLLRGYSLTEIAQMLNVTVTRVKQHSLRLQRESLRYSHSWR